LIAAPAIGSLIAEEAALLAFVGRTGAQKLLLWGMTNPGQALAITEIMAGYGVTLVEGGSLPTWPDVCATLQDPQATLMVVAQIFLEAMDVKMAGHGGGAEGSEQPAAHPHRPIAAGPAQPRRRAGGGAGNSP
jgi:hypothetical protein